MNFFLSTDIVIATGAARSLGDNLAELGICKPGILYDAALEGVPYFDDILAGLASRYGEGCLYRNDFGREPTYGHLERVAGRFRGAAPDGLAAIGGGSTMDLGKGVALLLENDVPALSLKGFPREVNDPLPLVTVPSILGSGSEVSFNAVFIDEEEGRKLGINSRKNFPRRAVIDPELSMSAPRASVISTAMDSLVHCVDSFGSLRHTALSRMFSVEGFRRTFTALQQDQLDRAEARIDLAIGSVCGTAALMNSGDGPSNGFAYYLGVKKGVPHGLAGAIFLKEVMRYNVEQGYDRYALLNPVPAGGSAMQSSRDLLDQMDELYRRHDVPTLVSYGYGKGNMHLFAKEASQALQGSFGGNPVPFDEQAALEVVGRLT